MPLGRPNADEYGGAAGRGHRLGIPNLGNTCYVGAVLQCLFHCKGFTHLVSDARRYGEGRRRGALTEALDALNRCIHADEPTVGTEGRASASGEPRGELVSRFLRAFGAAYPLWPVHRQQDAQEFCACLIDRVTQESHEEGGDGLHGRGQGKNGTTRALRAYPALSDLPRDVYATPCRASRISPSVSVATTSAARDALGMSTVEKTMYDQALRHWLCAHPRGHSEMDDTFHGQYVSQVRCGRCGATFHNFEMLDVVPVSFAAAETDQKPTVTSCLDAFFGDEPLDGWRCDACHALSAPGTTKTYRCWKPPRVLLVAVKRFGVHPGMRKDTRQLDVENGVLNICRYGCGPLIRLAKRDDLHAYRFVSAACHSGKSMGSGHYYAVGRTGTSSWSVYDDDQVRPLACPSLTPSSTLYLLAYERCRSTRSAGG